MDHRGISAIAKAVTLTLQRSWTPGLIEGSTPEFVVYRSRDFADPMRDGLSVFVYQLSSVPELRNLQRVRTPPQGAVSVQVSFILTAWAESAFVEEALLGWGACTLAANPVLDTVLLNEAAPGVCAPEDTIQLRTADSDELVRQLWPVLPCSAQLSLPYVTSAVQLQAR